MHRLTDQWDAGHHLCWASEDKDCVGGQGDRPWVNAILTDADAPMISEDLLFVPGDVPPFFRVPRVEGAVFVRDDVRRLISRAALQGVEFKLDTWLLE